MQEKGRWLGPIRFFPWRHQIAGEGAIELIRKGKNVPAQGLVTGSRTAHFP
jgi:hypothetical protein